MRLILALMLLLAGTPLHAETGSLPDAVRILAPDWRAIGQGEMRWFGLALYEATLWSPASGLDPQRPYALSLRYARDIPAGRLVDASMDEMRRLGAADEARLARWREALVKVFPSVRKGDVIVGVFLPQQGAAFYHQGRLTGEVRDPSFAVAFFAIWLDPRTREPALRERLLGATS